MLHTKNDRIVIVDDMPDCSFILEQHLLTAGFENIAVYEEPLKALDDIKSGIQPAVVITDFHMPIMNGLDLLEKIQDANPQIDGVIMTADIENLQSQNTRYHVFEKNGALSQNLIKFLQEDASS